MRRGLALCREDVEDLVVSLWVGVFGIDDAGGRIKGVKQLWDREAILSVRPGGRREDVRHRLLPYLWRG